jgi:hypothetical protein
LNIKANQYKQSLNILYTISLKYSINLEIF